MAFERLIRFEDETGKVHYGNLPYEFPSGGIGGKEVEILRGNVLSGFSASGEKATVKKVQDLVVNQTDYYEG